MSAEKNKKKAKKIKEQPQEEEAAPEAPAKIPLGARVKSHGPRTTVEGTVILRKESLGGYTLYDVAFNKNDGALLGNADYTAHLHPHELEVIHEDDTRPDGLAEFEVGQRVILEPAGHLGVVTAQNFSHSGCVEYDVTYHEPGRGIIRQVFEAPLLRAVEGAPPVERGQQEGSSYHDAVRSA